MTAPSTTFALELQVCAASIERAAERWFTSGRVVDTVVASAAVPGLLRPAVVDGEHYLDGGIVNSIPVGRAVECGAERIFVLQVGRVDKPLRAPRKPWEVSRVSFEIARRHRFHREMAALPEHVARPRAADRWEQPQGRQPAVLPRLPRRAATHQPGLHRDRDLSRGARAVKPLLRRVVLARR